MSVILFYSPVKDVSLFERVGFYATDIKILRDLGHVVVTTNSLRDVVHDKYDVLFAYFYTWSVFAVIFARLRRKITFITGGADELDLKYNKSKWRLLVHQNLFRLGYIFSTKVIAVSVADFNNFAKLVGHKKITLIPHVVNTDFFIPGLSQELTLLLTIGWMGSVENVRRKGMLAAIALLAELRSQNLAMKLVIAGTPGPGTKILKELAIKLNISDYIEFKFNISEIEKLELLQRSAYYIQLSEFEGFGLAALEALSCGSCVIHTGRGGLSDFMSDLGLLQTWPLDTKAIASTIALHKISRYSSNDEIIRRHAYVVENFSVAKRSKAFALEIND